MGFGIQQSRKEKTWTSILLEESEFSLRSRHAKREHTFRRMYMSVFVLFGAGFLVLASLFYVGAFFDVGKIVGVSQSYRAERAKTKVSTGKLKRNILSPLTDLVELNRIYMRSGQSILATYSIPKGAEMTLTIKQCKTRPVIEVFDCELIGQTSETIRRKTKGFHRFTVANPGFYHFEQTVKYRSGKTTSTNYRVVWQRG